MQELALYIPMVHEKIASNLNHYLKALEEQHAPSQQVDAPAMQADPASQSLA
jgi:hypothetical protein